MAQKRPNKQQRQRQNRQQRQARQARSVHAGEATAISRGERETAEPTASVRAAGKGTSGKAAPAKGGRPPRYTIPGQRAVVMAFLFTLVSAGTLLLAPVQVQREVDIDDPVLQEIDEDEQEVDEEAGTVTYVDDAKLLDEEGPAVAAGVMLTPILISGAAVWFTKRPQRSNVWTMAMIGLAAYIFLFAGPYGIITLPAMIALAVGGFQSRRAESKERLAELRAKKEAAVDGEEIDGEVIDVDSTEVEGADDPDDTDVTDAAEPVGDEDRR
ncbi:MAG TPA: hypothetical protein VMN58_03550 [Acidimicrobiales bacterium]|nr:hypothetical protein [Acidimicrobiales bacterium]